MKSTGIVRNIDDLGRVVIPKEIRRTLRIREGDPMEIFSNNDGGITLKKYSPILSIDRIAKKYCNLIYSKFRVSVCITDTDYIVATNNKPEYKRLVSVTLSDDFIKQVFGRTYRTNLAVPALIEKEIRIVAGSEDVSKLIFPISVSGDLIGSIVLLETAPNEADNEVLKTCIAFIQGLIQEELDYQL